MFIAIIVNALQSFTESNTEANFSAVDQARDHVETDMHAEIKALRTEIGELKPLLRDQ